LLNSIETLRLRLRCPELDDVDVLPQLLTEGVSRWVAAWPLPLTREMALEKVTRARADAASGSALPYIIESKSNLRPIGWVGVTRKAESAATLGYWLGEEHHGCGLMREAAEPVVETAFRVMGLETIDAAAQLGNSASFAVLRHCGFREVGSRMIYAPARDRLEMCIAFQANRSSRRSGSYSSL
jgi:ribosomal-protein-alanine N-acetyltransferase